MDDKQRQYHCVMAKERVEGYCEVLIHDSYRRSVELFRLDFFAEGRMEHQYLHAEEALLWQQYNDVHPITYRQAMTLVGDAVQKSYNQCAYGVHCVGAGRSINLWEHCSSFHVQRVLQGNYYGGKDMNLNWLLQPLKPTQLVRIYLNAINNKDAVLLYDLLADAAKLKIDRTVYAYTWSHVLEEMQLNSYEILHAKESPDRQTQHFYLCVSGELWDQRLIEAELCIKLVLEDGCWKVLEEQVLDAICITGKND